MLKVPSLTIFEIRDVFVVECKTRVFKTRKGIDEGVELVWSEDPMGQNIIV